MAVIRVEHLKKEFEYYKKGTGLQGSLHNLFHREMLKKEAVKDISFSVERGEMIGLLGPNGAGKTTTLKMLSGILFPTAGEVEIDGYIPWERKNAFKRRFSIVMGQKNQLWWDLPASDSFYLNKCIFDVPDGEYRRTVEELSELLDVKDLMNVQVRRLSLGERMKMEILAALIHRPDILFLDEPTIGLDILSQQKIRDFLKTYNEQTKTTVILTSHYMRDIEELCRRAVIINQGQLVYDGTLADINHRMGDRKLLSLKSIEPVPREHLSLFGRVREYHGREAVLEVPKGKIKETASAILSLLPVEDFTVTEIPLEESIALFFKRGDCIMNPYRCTFQMGMEKALEYRVNFVLSLLSAVFPIVIQTFLWNYLYGNSDAAAMTGYSYSQIMVYTLLASMVSHLVYTGFEYQVNEDIKNGGLNKYLVKPVNYRSYQFFHSWGRRLLSF